MFAQGNRLPMKAVIEAKRLRFAVAMPEHNELASLPGVSQVDVVNRTFRLYTKLPGQVVTEVVRLADRKGLEITDLSNRKPSLEDVFLHFTSECKERGLQ